MASDNKNLAAAISKKHAYLQIWSLGHWLYEGVASSVTFGSVGSDLELNLAYANSWLFPPLFTAAWLSPIWVYIAYLAFSRLRATRPPPPKTLASRQLTLGLDDLILTLAIVLTCVFVGFYPYFHDPPWLVGTDAY
jgi:hypothetical protein